MGLLNFESFNGADFLNLDVLAKQIFKFERFAKWIKFMRDACGVAFWPQSSILRYCAPVHFK